jgi:hypothetical protein
MVYGVFDPKTNKLHRVTFSRGLAQFIVERYHPEMECIKMQFTRGDKLRGDQKSRGAYAIVGTSKDIVLRVALRKELADVYTDGLHRHQEEIFLERL